MTGKECFCKALYVINFLTFSGFSYVPPSQRRGERWAELLFCDSGGDGAWHQGEPVLGAWRVRREPLRHKDRLHPRGGAGRPHVHPGREPSGKISSAPSIQGAVLPWSFGCDNTVYAQALKVLKTAEFMPFVVFIAAPELDTLRGMHKAVIDAGLTTKILTVILRNSCSRIVRWSLVLSNSSYCHQSITGLPLLLQENDLKKTVDESARIRRAYSHYFDLTIVNDNLDKAFDKLQDAVERLFVEPQWVPVSWVYWSSSYWTCCLSC